MDVLERELAEFASGAVPPAPTLGSLRRRGLQLRRRRRARRLCAGTAAFAVVAMAGVLVTQPAPDSTIVADDGQSEVSTATTVESTPDEQKMSLADARSVLQRLHDYHAAPGTEVGDANENVDPAQLLDRLRVADSVGLALGSEVVATRTREELQRGVYDAAWNVSLDGYGERDGVYAFGLFFQNTRPEEYSVGVGDFERCGQGSRPPEFADAERINVQPAEEVPCSEWWALDVFVDDAGQIVGINASWAE